MSAVATAPEAPGRKFSLLKPLTWLVVVLVVAITVIPLIFVIEGGFRSTAQINASPVGLPHPWVWSNYTSVLFSSAFWRFLFNSAFIAVVATAGAVGLGSMAAFALSRIEFWGREAIFTFSRSACCSRSASRACRSTCCCSASECWTTCSGWRSPRPRSHCRSRS
jgi:ABC-type glycerol-3-phosphate transport system permease component